MKPGDEGYDDEIMAKAMQAIEKDRDERKKELAVEKPERPGVIIGTQGSDGFIAAVDQ